jgi:hypothetical protein
MKKVNLKGAQSSLQSIITWTKKIKGVARIKKGM